MLDNYHDEQVDQSGIILYRRLTERDLAPLVSFVVMYDAVDNTHKLVKYFIAAPDELTITDYVRPFNKAIVFASKDRASVVEKYQTQVNNILSNSDRHGYTTGPLPTSIPEYKGRNVELPPAGFDSVGKVKRGRYSGLSEEEIAEMKEKTRQRELEYYKRKKDERKKREDAERSAAGKVKRKYVRKKNGGK